MAGEEEICSWGESKKAKKFHTWAPFHNPIGSTYSWDESKERGSHSMKPHITTPSHHLAIAMVTASSLDAGKRKLVPLSFSASLFEWQPLGQRENWGHRFPSTQAHFCPWEPLVSLSVPQPPLFLLQTLLNIIPSIDVFFLLPPSS